MIVSTRMLIQDVVSATAAALQVNMSASTASTVEMLNSYQRVRIATRRIRGVLNFRFRSGQTNSEVRKTFTKLR